MTAKGPGKLVREDTTTGGTTYLFRYDEPGSPGPPEIPPEPGKEITVETDNQGILDKMEKAYDAEDETVVIAFDATGTVIGISTTKP